MRRLPGLTSFLRLCGLRPCCPVQRRVHRLSESALSPLFGAAWASDLCLGLSLGKYDRQRRWKAGGPRDISDKSLARNRLVLISIPCATYRQEAACQESAVPLHPSGEISIFIFCPGGSPGDACRRRLRPFRCPHAAPTAAAGQAGDEGIVWPLLPPTADGSPSD